LRAKLVVNGFCCFDGHEMGSCGWATVNVAVWWRWTSLWDGRHPGQTTESEIQATNLSIARAEAVRAYLLNARHRAISFVREHASSSYDAQPCSASLDVMSLSVAERPTSFASSSSLRIGPLDKALGAVVEGFDVRRTLTGAEIHALKHALRDHHILLFSGPAGR
jgi:hypothetical protein